MSCTYKQFKNERLCVADLTHEITIAARTIAGDHPDNAGQATTTLHPLFALWCAVETPSSHRPVQSLVADRSITHIFYVRYDEWADLLDTARIAIDSKQHMIMLDGQNYRIDQVRNMNMRNQIIALNCELTGSGQESLA